MPRDTNAFLETSAPTRTLEQRFADWVREQPAGEEYDFCDASKCALAQFGAAVGIPLGDVNCDRLDRLGLLEVLNPLWGDWTYSALATRLAEQGL